MAAVAAVFGDHRCGASSWPSSGSVWRSGRPGWRSWSMRTRWVVRRRSGWWRPSSCFPPRWRHLCWQQPPIRLPRHRALVFGYPSQAVAAALTWWAMASGQAPPLVVGFAALTAILITATRPAHIALIPELSDRTRSDDRGQRGVGHGGRLRRTCGSAHRRSAARGRRPGIVFLAMAVVLAASAATVAGASARQAPALVVRVSPIRTLLGGVCDGALRTPHTCHCRSRWSCSRSWTERSMCSSWFWPSSCWV